MISIPELVTFIVYLVFLMAVGLYFYRRTANLEDYLLGGRNMGTWVTALSAQASDMSGWLLMGLPGAVFLFGINQSWIAIGLFIGTVVNWILVAPRLRLHTERTRSITLPSFLENRFKDPTGLLRVISSIIILFFFTIYASSGLVAAGRLFESMFAVNYQTAVLIGGVVIVAYTFLGGFLAVCWTDLIQGTLMLVAVVVVPAVALISAGGVAGISQAMAAREISAALIPAGPLPLIAIISTMAWGLGYFGQPHILARFMSIRSVRELPKATTIAVVWVAFSLGFAVIVGLVGIPLFPDLAGPEAETVFIRMIRLVFSPWIGGILLAAILSAIMSTIDSQLLVSSSALTEDIYKRSINREAGEQRLMWIGRVSVIAISIVALVLALNPQNTILGLVAYAWGGFGAAFGPVILMALFSRKATWQAALAGMVTGTVVLVLWERLGLGATMYEIVPGFIANYIAIMITNRLVQQTDEAVIRDFDEIKAQLAAD
ncbi:MAG: sodium/proline symporter PutP [Spirochaetaceae bacterium]|nr:MAG: sodium/proline symporter PutP [Spirochaetaceae bacterium]